MTYSHSIKKAIQSHFEKEGWNYSFDEEDAVFRAGMRFGGKLKRCDIKAYIDNDHYLVYGEIAVGAVTDNIQAVAEYLHRVNCRLKYGSFEFDYDDGAIRFKVFTDCGDNCDCIPSSSVIERNLEMPAIMFEKYGDGLLSVLFGYAPPIVALQAIQERENQDEANA